MSTTPEEILSSKEQWRLLYKDPRWKAFAAKVRAFYANKCTSCHATDKVTQVHHWKYQKGRMPWEYSIGEVDLLCSGCHSEYHEHHQNFRQYIFPKLTPRAFQVLNGALLVGFETYDPLELSYAIAALVSSPHSVKRFLHDFANSANPSSAKGKTASAEPEAASHNSTICGLTGATSYAMREGRT